MAITELGPCALTVVNHLAVDDYIGCLKKINVPKLEDMHNLHDNAMETAEKFRGQCARGAFVVCNVKPRRVDHPWP
ncbi:hypothetical protein NC653_010795 [Populus alba x Populus x berolinensis]|uniref:Uncharacterized protein n=1 Tax=Populus alba x Populus x berolinensis TaxID=444605 RepID=A0AAD6R0R6_9ROSI|nr:hypothetical protein NC653_010795 [Populus alba x Populus x berolinensis]